MVLMILPRHLTPVLLAHAKQFRVLTLTGPRQSGKTTLCRSAFPEKPYVSLEDPSERKLALDDPHGFLARFPRGAVLDEAQRAPELLSYVQGIVDEHDRRGEWVLTGSYNFGLLRAITQSLAGRTSLLTLLPLSLSEMSGNLASASLAEEQQRGGYPEPRTRGIRAYDWYSSYVGTYLERDVREVLQVGNLAQFHTFLQLCAGRAGQLLNLSSLGADCGVSHNTVREWISVLEASYIAFRLPPLHRSVSKRLMKSPKLYFYDTGLLCHLLQIREPEQVAKAPQRGAIFENWVVSEVLKRRQNRALAPDLCFYRDYSGREVDLVVGRGRRVIAVEIKSSSTFHPEFASGFPEVERAFASGAGPAVEVEKAVVFGGAEGRVFQGARVLPWNEVDGIDWASV